MIFFVGFIQSYLINTSAMTIISQSKIRQVVPVSLATGAASRLSLLIIGSISDWNLLVMASDWIGDSVGDLAVNRRWPRPVYDFLVRKTRGGPKRVKPPQDLTPKNYHHLADSLNPFNRLNRTVGPKAQHPKK